MLEVVITLPLVESLFHRSHNAIIATQKVFEVGGSQLEIYTKKGALLLLKFCFSFLDDKISFK